MIPKTNQTKESAMGKIKDLCDMSIESSREKQRDFRFKIMKFVDDNGGEADTENLHEFVSKKMEEDEDFKAILLIGAVNGILNELEENKKENRIGRVISEALKSSDNGQNFATKVLDDLGIKKDGGVDEGGSGITH